MARSCAFGPHYFVSKGRLVDSDWSDDYEGGEASLQELICNKHYMQYFYIRPPTPPKVAPQPTSSCVVAFVVFEIVVCVECIAPIAVRFLY